MEDKKPCHNTADTDRKSSHLLPKSRLIFLRPERERGETRREAGREEMKAERCVAHFFESRQKYPSTVGVNLKPFYVFSAW